MVVEYGRITKDLELKAAGDTSLCSFTIAVNGFKKGEVSFFDCKAWGKKAETISTYFHKGSRIIVIGDLKQETWEKDGQNRSKVIINVSDFKFIDTKAESGASTPAQASKPAQAPIMDDDDDSDVPF